MDNESPCMVCGQQWPVVLPKIEKDCGYHVCQICVEQNYHVHTDSSSVADCPICMTTEDVWELYTKGYWVLRMQGLSKCCRYAQMFCEEGFNFATPAFINSMKGNIHEVNTDLDWISKTRDNEDQALLALINTLDGLKIDLAALKVTYPKVRQRRREAKRAKSIVTPEEHMWKTLGENQAKAFYAVLINLLSVAVGDRTRMEKVKYDATKIIERCQYYQQAITKTPGYKPGDEATWLHHGQESASDLFEYINMMELLY